MRNVLKHCIKKTKTAKLTDWKWKTRALGDHDASQGHCSSTNAGQNTGTLTDLATDTYYITDKAASKLNLRSEEITLAWLRCRIQSGWRSEKFTNTDSLVEELVEYAITFNFGDKQAGCMAQLAMHETANFPFFCPPQRRHFRMTATWTALSCPTMTVTNWKPSQQMLNESLKLEDLSSIHGSYLVKVRERSTVTSWINARK